MDPPGQSSAPIPTLEPAATLPATPMLRSRFGFAGRWHNVHAGLDWLDVPGMASPWHDAATAARIDIRREHWEHCVLNEAARSRLSLFAIDLLDQGEVYLLWPEQPENTAEPMIVQYVDYSEKRFENLRAYVEYLVEPG